EKRGVPKENVIVLDLPKGEDIGRRDYQAKIVEPVRTALKDRKKQARVLLSIYGVPLRVGRQGPNEKEKGGGKERQTKVKELQRKINELQREQSELQQLLASLEAEGKEEPPGNLAATIKERRKELQEVQSKLKPLEKRQRHFSYAESEACVDSELMLLWW